ncbi:MAG: hypothetical protein P1V51_05645 [Deltaproteobacteria bacterium]|nr:hypothetical protein [Deltaproteobacteria bacterium]
MRKLILKSLALVLCGGAAALGLALDPGTIASSSAIAPRAVTPLLHGDLPAYPGVAETRVGRGLSINGQRVDMHQFFTDDAPEVVADHYEQVLSAAVGGEVHRYQVGNADYVGVMNDEGRFVQVMILADGEGSLVIPNVADGPLRPGREVSSLKVPLPPDASNLSTFRSQDGGKVATSAQFLTELDMLGMSEFYRAKMPALGFRQLEGAVVPESLGENGLMRFAGPEGDIVSIGVQSVAERRGCLVYLLHEVPIDPDAPEAAPEAAR